MRTEYTAFTKLSPSYHLFQTIKNRNWRKQVGKKSVCDQSGGENKELISMEGHTIPGKPQTEKLGGSAWGGRSGRVPVQVGAVFICLGIHGVDGCGTDLVCLDNV